MIRVTRTLALVVSAIAIGLVPLDVCAQSVDRPWRGLFGQSAGTSDHGVSAFGSVFAGYDDNRLRELQGVRPEPGDERFYSSGSLLGATIGVGYVGTFGPVSLNASAGVGLRYYPDENQTLVVPTNAGGAGSGFTWQLGRRTSLVLSGAVDYRPYYTLATPDLALGEAPLEEPIPPPATDEDFALAQRPSLFTAGNVYIQHEFSRVTSFQAGYDVGLRYFFSEADADLYGDSTRQRAFGRLTRRMTRYTNLRAGYGYRWFTDTNAERPPLHEIDAGVDYNRALSLSRQATISFDMGTSALVSDPQGGGPGEPVGDARLRFRLKGGATLSYLLGRSWIASAGYRRDVDYMDGFAEPFNRDSFTAQLGGLLNRRVSAQASARYSFGYVGFTNDGDNDFGNVAASAGITAALNRFLAAYASAFYYDYGFGEDVALPELVARDQERFGARVGLTTTVPLWP